MNAPAPTYTPSILPSGIEQETTRDALVFSRSWRNASSWALLPIGIVLAGFCAALFHATQRATPGHPVHYIPIGTALVTSIYLYMVFARLLNRTRIHLSEFGILVTHGPLPWKVEQCSEWDQIRRVYLKEVKTSYQTVSVTFHHLWADKADGKSTPLVVGDMTESQASYLLHQIQSQWNRFQSNPAEFGKDLENNDAYAGLSKAA